MDNKKIGLYIHIPYCKRKCLYCSFYSLECEEADETLFLRLLGELEEYKNDDVVVDTVFIGGGTPSLLSVDQIKRMFAKIKKVFTLTDDAEITIELNPDSATEPKMLMLKSVGVNRISFGVQSFIDDELRSIGRLHDSTIAKRSINNSKKYFENVNVDLMVGLPQQTTETLAISIDEAIALGVTHVSVYSLILEDGTPLKQAVDNGSVRLPDQDQTVELYDFAVNRLKKTGYSRYEISNFCLKGYRCKHNYNCWRFNEYIGIGPSAHSFYKNERFSNVNDVTEYLKGNSSRVYYPIESDHSRIIEYVMLALRTVSGIDKNDFQKRFGLNFDELFADVLAKNEICRTCHNTTKAFFIRNEYFYVSNSIIVDFMEALE